MTDGVDAPAETEADAAVAAFGQHLVPVHASRGYQVRRSLLTALAIAVLVSVIAYRLVNFWLVLVAGWILMAILAHRRAGPSGSSPAPAV